MKPDIDTLLERLVKLSDLLAKQCQAKDMQEFWVLNKKFEDLKTSYKLEDELNEKL